MRSRASLIALALLAIIASLFVAKDVDFRVYWLAAVGYFNGTRPAYGPQSGLGFPMEYRYAPATYLLIWPFRFLPLRAAGFCWMLLAWINAGWTMWLALRVRRLRFDRASILAVLAYLCAYLVLAVRYGNVQPFAIAWIFAALMLAESRPLASGVLLALAATFKIWPVLFVPWLFPPLRRRAAIWFGVSLATIWIVPFAIFGSHEYSTLLRDWYGAVSRVGTTYSEFYYFPGQSIRGLLLRWLTPVAPPLNYFPRINILSLDPKTAVHLWMVAGGVLYVAFAIWMLRSDRRTQWVWDGVAFVLYSMIEPYAVKSGLVSLAPAVITAGCLFALRNDEQSASQHNGVKWANRLFLTASAISFAQALLQYKPWQRYLLSFGLDFWGECVLLAAFALWISRTSLPLTLNADASGQASNGSHHASGVFGLTPVGKKLSALTGRT